MDVVEAGEEERVNALNAQNAVYDIG